MEYASIKQRFLATALDIFIILAFLSLISVLFRETKVHISILTLFEKIRTMDAPFAYFVRMLYDISSSTGIVTGLMQLLFIVVYWIVLPIVWPRQTMGRAIFFVKVVKLNGQKLTFGTLVIRELMAKVLLFLFTLGIIAIVNIFFIARSNGHRAIHDRMANTLVVTCKPEQLC